MEFFDRLEAYPTGGDLTEGCETGQTSGSPGRSRG